MTTALEVGTGRKTKQEATATATARTVAALWRQVDRNMIVSSWQALVPRALLAVYAGQVLGGETADEYVTAALSAQDIDTDRSATFAPRSLSGVASDGRPLDSLLRTPASLAVRAIATGTPSRQALATAGAHLEAIVMTQIQDAWRVAASTSAITRPAYNTYVRALRPPSCSRCAILAGAYSYSRAFQRHPRCDCIAIPSRENVAGDYATSPKDYFDSLSKREQDRIFTNAGAEAIRDGADIGRVVNARRKAAGLDTAQGRLMITRELARPGGIRLMPESIYRLGTTREERMRMLRENGYIY